MNTYKPKDVVRVVVKGKTRIAVIAASVENGKKGRPRFRLLADDGATIERDAVGLKPGEPGDREKLSQRLAALV